MSYIGNIPTFTIPKSKYSSTETEYSSDDGGTSYIEDHNGKLSLSGFSTSAASSSGSSRKRTKRRRRSTSSNSRLSSSSINLSHRSDKSGSTSTRYSITPCASIAEYSQTELCEVTGKRTRNVAALNSIYDLKHAIGRHRGISGSFGAVDAALFAMFYVTDIFDGLLTEDINQHFLQCHEQLLIGKDVISILRKEIVYSLRINYFCPASKVVKLIQLIEKYNSLQNIQGSADFLDLLFGKLLKSSSFFTYSEGTDGFIHPINLENYLARKYYYQPLALTVQSILRQLNVYPTRIANDLNATRGTSFSAVPYPALILKIVRKALNGTGTENGSMYYWDNSTETHHHHHKRPVIPNLQIDLTDLMITRKNYDNISNLQNSYSSNWDKSTVINQSLTTSLISVGKDFSYERKIGVGVARSESRFVKGMKSAWKTMFHYLEDLTLSSSNMIPPESGGGRDFTSIEINTHNDDGSLERINSLFTTSNSLSSFPTTRSTHLYSGSIHELKKEPVLSTTRQKVKVKMELIAIICKSQTKNGIGTNSEKTSSFSVGYSVYCKAGKDGAEFAPWVLYQPRNGVAPQVQLIENFGTWIDSLERHHESFSLHKVPSEIRIVLEDSHLLIYKRVEK